MESGGQLCRTHRAAVDERVDVHGPLTAQTQEDLHHADDRDAHQAHVIVLVDTVDEDPAVDPQALQYHERHDVAVEHPSARIVQADRLHEIVYPWRGHRHDYAKRQLTSRVTTSEERSNVRRPRVLLSTIHIDGIADSRAIPASRGLADTTRTSSSRSSRWHLRKNRR